MRCAVLLLLLGGIGVFLMTRDIQHPPGDYIYPVAGLIFAVVAAIGIIRILLAAEVPDDEDDEHEEESIG